MNYFHNPYFPLIYHQPYLENPISPFPESSHQDDSQRYLRILQSENQLLKEKVTILQEKLKNYEQIDKDSQTITLKKKITQKQTLVYECEYPNCKRTYKSTLALNLHIKMKHNGGSIREREAYAKLIMQCQRDNKPKPEININFPPNFLENYRKRMLLCQNTVKQSST